MENLSLEVLRRSSQILLWVSIILPVIAAFAVGTRYYIEAELGKRIQDDLKGKITQSEQATSKLNQQLLDQSGVNLRLTNELEESKKEVSNIKQKTEDIEYQDIAQYNAIGNKSGKVNGIPFVSTPINDWSNRFVSRENEDLNFKCAPEAIHACKAVIEKLPLYPFSHYFLAQCLKDQQNTNWQKHARKAREILIKTTSIPGHSKDHDLALTQIDEWFKSE